MKPFAALLREADEIERLEAQIQGKEHQLSGLRKSLNLFRNCYEQLLKDTDVSTGDVRHGTFRLKELQQEKQTTRKMEEPLSVFMQNFSLLLKQILSASLLLTATSLPAFPKLPSRKKFFNSFYNSGASVNQITTQFAPKIIQQI